MEKGKIFVTVLDKYEPHLPIVEAPISVYLKEGEIAPVDEKEQKEPPKKERKHKPDLQGCRKVFDGITNQAGQLERALDHGRYIVTCDAFVDTMWEEVYVEPGCTVSVCFDVPVGIDIEFLVLKEDCKPPVPCTEATEGSMVIARGRHQLKPEHTRRKPIRYSWRGPFSEQGELLDTDEVRFIAQAGQNEVAFTIRQNSSITRRAVFNAYPQAVQRIAGNVGVTLRRTATAPTPDLPLWIVIRKSAEAISFDNYNHFMDLVLCGIGKTPQRPTDVETEFGLLRQRRFLPYNDADAYRLLKVATEAFLMVNCGVFLAQPNFTQADLDYLLSRVSLDGRVIDINALNTLWRNYLEIVNGGPDATIPYLALIRDKLRDVGLKSSVFAAEDPSIDLPQDCFGILREKLTHPCFLELIWSYWHEEGMLVQTMNALSQRFQNIRSAGDRDPLAMLEIDPLRPLNNLLWGYIQDEQHRLSIVRRVYEYDHHYGLTLYGKAVPNVRPADSRSKFLEAFHNLLYLCTIFFQQDDDTTVIADGFPVLNALKEVHLILTQGAHNQFGDLPSTARQEMLVQQWILARPEFREFLPTRIMVAYPERWMDRVDAMKSLQGWSDVSVLHFHNLGVFGEQIFLSIRFGAWSTVNDPVQAANWARFWRAEIQGYIHAYRAVTGVDLSSEITDSRQASERYLQPSVHLRNRLAMQRQKV